MRPRNPLLSKKRIPLLNEATLSANLVALRLEKNLSQAKEAEILYVSKRSIINYEQGESYPSIETLLLLLQTYSISAKSFFYEKRSIPNNQPAFIDPKKRRRKS
jgi:transcriptional regulator with XRE-family HTH domain